MTDKQVNLTSGSRLARNVIWNLIGTGAPLLVAIVAIPLLIEGLGLARFGVLTLAWMVVGYFSLFDLGLGRALTKLVAEKLGEGRTSEVPSLVWTAMLLMVALGVLGAIFVSSISPWLVGEVLNIPIELQAETLNAFYLLSVSIPIVIITTGLRGVLEAHQRFGLVNAVRVSLGLITFLGPLGVLFFSNSLVPIVAILIIARLVSLCVYVILCLRVEPRLRHFLMIRWSTVRPLIGFGGWMTVSNIVGPLMVYMDRFLIGAVVSMTAVAYYATPYEVVTKLWIIPGALMGVMFPAFVAALAQDQVRAASLFYRSVNYIFLSLFPLVLIVVTLAYDGLSLWIDPEFAKHSAPVLQLLAIGIFINSLAHVPLGFIQGKGRPDLTAKLHLVELPFYLLILWWLLGGYGIVGAAVAWAVRVTFDTISLYIITQKLFPPVWGFTIRMAVMASIAVLILVLAAVITDVVMKSGFLLLILSGFMIVAWKVLLTTRERDFIRGHLKAISVFN